MAKHFDLSKILNDERPTIKIGDKTYTVNDEKSNVLILNSRIPSMWQLSSCLERQQ